MDVTEQAQRQRLIGSFVNVIYLYDDKAVWTFHYNDGAKTLTYAEIQGSDLIAQAAPIKLHASGLEPAHGVLFLACY